MCQFRFTKSLFVKLAVEELRANFSRLMSVQLIQVRCQILQSCCPRDLFLLCCSSPVLFCSVCSASIFFVLVIVSVTLPVFLVYHFLCDGCDIRCHFTLNYLRRYYTWFCCSGVYNHLFVCRKIGISNESAEGSASHRDVIDGAGPSGQHFHPHITHHAPQTRPFSQPIPSHLQSSPVAARSHAHSQSAGRRYSGQMANPSFRQKQHVHYQRRTVSKSTVILLPFNGNQISQLSAGCLD